MQAVVTGNCDAASNLIAAGAQPQRHELNPSTSQHESVLFTALRRGDAPMVAVLCKAAGLNPDDPALMEMALTPLYELTQLLLHALQEKKPSRASRLLACFDVLMQFGADINRASPLLDTTVWDLLAESGLEKDHPLHCYYRSSASRGPAAELQSLRLDFLEGIAMSPAERSVYVGLVLSTVSTLFDDSPSETCETDSPQVKQPSAAYRS